MLDGKTSLADMGTEFSQGAQGVYQLEIDYLINHELAVTQEDILWRRTKLGLYLSEEEQSAITDYIRQSLQDKVVTINEVNKAG
jgi:glycerol-3-phosphate dehydrogenase